ncbi:MAG: response regulator [Candidatus Omnitrophica bacterium]|nr:response regulator [Candidatus Omnitrophota bacterium]
MSAAHENPSVRVFLITADPDYPLFLNDIFKKHAPDCRLEHTGSLKDGLEFLKRGGADAVLVDLALPEAKGMDAFFSLRSRARGIPILVLAGETEEPLIEKAVRFGADDGLFKSERDAGRIARLVRRAVARNRAHRELCENLLLDDLTGLYNRRGFSIVAEQQLKLLPRTKKGHLFFHFQVANLNKMNEGLGYKEGSRALTRAAEILKTSFRRSDVLCRYGGDAFAVCAIDAVWANLEVIAKRFRDNLKFYNDNVAEFYRLELTAAAAAADSENVFSAEELVETAKNFF